MIWIHVVKGFLNFFLIQTTDGTLQAAMLETLMIMVS